MSSNKKKNFKHSELKWGALKTFDGIKNNTANFTFDSYLVFYVDKDGLCRNVVSQEETYRRIESIYRSRIENLQVGEKLLETISDSADIVLYRAFDTSKKNNYSVKDIENAILACDAFYFKDAEEIKVKRNNKRLVKQIRKN